MLKKIISAALCLTLVVIMSLPLISCAKNEDNNTEVTESETGGTTEIQTTTEAKILPDLPDVKYDNYEYKIMSKGKFNEHWSARDISAESETGDAINDAVYRRNISVMERFGINITEVGTFSDPSGAAKKSILAATDEYDLLVITMQQLGGFAASGYLLDLSNVENIDLSKPWYDQNANKQLSVMNKVYITTGELTIMDKDATWSVLFNKKLAQEAGIEDLYKCVSDGKWTSTKMYETAKLGSKDINGDGIQDENDQWGIFSENFNAYALCVGGGGMIISKDKDDVPYFSVGEQKLIDAFMACVALQSDPVTTFVAQKYASKFKISVYSELIDKSFAENKGLYNFAGLNRVTLFRNMATDFGILPVPKANEEQEGYHCIVSQSSCTGISIPITASDPARTGAIFEALSAESLYTLTPAYYDVTLKTKSARDDESGAMLDIIFSSRVFDLGLTFGWGDFITTIENLANKGDTGIVSQIEKKMAGAQKALDKAMESFGELK